MENLYLEVNLYNIDKNIGIIRNILGNKKFIAVVKGDAYGLGENTVIFVELAVLVVGEAGHQVGTQSPGVTQQQLLAVGQSRAGHDYQD